MSGASRVCRGKLDDATAAVIGSPSSGARCEAKEVQMAGVEIGEFGSPDETRTPDKTTVEIVRMGSANASHAVGARLEMVGVHQAHRGRRALPGPPRRAAAVRDDARRPRRRNRAGNSRGP